VFPRPCVAPWNGPLVEFVKLREQLAFEFIVPQYGETVAYVIRILHKQRMNLTYKDRQHEFGAREKCKQAECVTAAATSMEILLFLKNQFAQSLLV
jgi:hypothetical protein